VDRPTHATIVKGFHKYIRAPKFPEGRRFGNSKDTIKRDEKECIKILDITHKMSIKKNEK